MPEIKIQPLFAKPLAFTKVHISDNDIEVIKELEYKKVDNYYISKNNIYDNLPDLTKEIESQVQAFNDNVMCFNTPVKLTSMWSLKMLPGQSGDTHNHLNSTYSFVVYTAPGMSCQFSNFGQEDMYLKHTDKYNIFNMRTFDMPVERGTLLIFKSNLPHRIQKTNVERYTISGNFVITDLDEFKII